MRKLKLALLCVALAACARTPPPQPATVAAPEPRTVSAEVVRDGAVWTVDFRFAQASPAWLFAHSAVSRSTRQPWRHGNWTVETPGVRIERRGQHDVLFAASGDVPAHVRVRFTPVATDLIAEYDPALLFSDGSVALWSGHFHLYPIASAAAVEALPLDLNGANFGGTGSQVRFTDRGGRVLHIGRRFDSATLIGGRAYVLFGGLEPVVSPDIATIIDPALPEWLKRELASTTPAILRRLAELLGPHNGPKPTVLVSWAGPTPGVTSMGGSTLPTQIGITFEGAGVAAENPRVRDRARTFIAHEAAHFWLGNTVRYQSVGDSWIMEGGADLLALRVIAALDPTFDPRPRLQEFVADCSKLAQRPVSSAAERRENRAFYACGALFGLIAEAASRQSFGTFIRPLIDANRQDGILTRDEWLSALDRASGDPSLRRDIELLLDRGAPAPGPLLASLFKRAGIPHVASADGVPLLR